MVRKPPPLLKIRVFTAMPEEGLEPPTRGYDSAVRPPWMERTVARRSCPDARLCGLLLRKSLVWGAFPARPERFELPTFGSVDRRSIQLSYGR
jgi:hypothetical protein